jgi:hypothetical protein
MSEDKVYRKDWCWFVRTDYVLEKLPDVSGPDLIEASRVHMSEDKVCRKDWCWFVRADSILEKLPDVSGPDLVEAGVTVATEID